MTLTIIVSKDEQEKDEDTKTETVETENGTVSNDIPTDGSVEMTTAPNGVTEVTATTSGGIASQTVDISTSTKSEVVAFYNAVVGNITWTLTNKKGTTFPSNWVYFGNDEGKGTVSGNVLTLVLPKGTAPIIVFDNDARLGLTSSAGSASVAATTTDVYTFSLDASGTDANGEDQDISDIATYNVAAETETSGTTEPVLSNGSSGGCNTGFGIISLALAGMFFARKRG